MNQQPEPKKGAGIKLSSTAEKSLAPGQLIPLYIEPCAKILMLQRAPSAAIFAFFTQAEKVRTSGTWRTERALLGPSWSQVRVKG